MASPNITSYENVHSKCPSILAGLLDKDYEELSYMNGDILYDDDLEHALAINLFATRSLGILQIRVRPDVLQCSEDMLTGGIAHELSHASLYLQGHEDHTEEDADKDVEERGYGRHLDLLKKWLLENKTREE